MNRYGIGPSVVRRRRSYMVEAECRIKAGFYARSAEEAEEDFNDLSAAIEDQFPGLVLEITDVYEDA
ncbi:hypothetical protein [Eubacterium callanderi]|uniref:hypothetical protein n=1 Tax=Eubacterium callanderi TaxID=53442 RepID=UPI0011DCC897|nr:hypothetical protein [Eubacterium callanderi]WPK75261.1 hypothetical protein EUCAG14_08010 [Eubacterium callanderi]GFZ23921.1 hypothetical protein CMETHOX_18440 [[Clostridium] methoxybenzovorans]